MGINDSAKSYIIFSNKVTNSKKIAPKQMS